LYKNTITLKRNNSIATLFFNKNCNNIYHLLKTFPDNEIMELDEELLKSLGNKIWEFDGVYKNWNTYNELIDKIPYTNHHTNIVFSIFNINKDFSLLEIVDFFKSLEQKGYNNENMYFIISLCNDNINKYALLYTI
jgi:predicted acetyltransferase